MVPNVTNNLAGRLALAGPIKCQGGIVKRSMKVHKNAGKIVVMQKARIWFRIAVSIWAVVVLLTPFMIYSEIFTTQATHFTCDRGTGVCAVNGRTAEVPRLADVARAEITHDFNRRDGPNYGIDLITRDGKRHSIEEQRAIKDSVIADYRVAVKAINSYLANPAEQKLDASFTYKAGLSEILQSFFYLVFGVVTLFLGLLLWNKRMYTIEPGKITLALRGLLQRDKQEIDSGRIAAIAVRADSRGRLVELRLDDDSRVPLVIAGLFDSPKADQLTQELAVFLGKPVENASS